MVLVSFPSWYVVQNLRLATRLRQATVDDRGCRAGCCSTCRTTSRATAGRLPRVSRWRRARCESSSRSLSRAESWSAGSSAGHGSTSGTHVIRSYLLCVPCWELPSTAPRQRTASDTSVGAHGPDGEARRCEPVACRILDPGGCSDGIRGAGRCRHHGSTVGRRGGPDLLQRPLRFP